MTGQELERQILDLGFKSQYDLEFEKAAVMTAMNRALDEVNRIRPEAEDIELVHSPIRPVKYYRDVIYHRGGEDLSFVVADVKAVAFEVQGNGRAYIGSPDTDITHELEWRDARGFVVKKGLVARMLDGYGGETVRLRFTGDFPYMIRNLSFYSELRDGTLESLTVYSPYTGYDMKESCFVGERFYAFDGVPVRSGELGELCAVDYKVSGSILYLPSDCEGIYRVRVRVRPRRIDRDDLGEEIEIDPELCVLLPLRAAYYLYLESEPDLAQNYNVEYQRLYSVLMRRTQVRTPTKLRNIRGW